MSGRFRADGLSHACSASPLLRRRLAGTRATGKCECVDLRLRGAPPDQRCATEIAATSAPRKTRTPPARMNSCGARCAGTNGTARIKIPTNARDPARIIVSPRAAFAPGRVAARTPQNMKIAPSATTPAGREGKPIRPVAASKISNAPSSSTINSLSSRNRLLGVAMRASCPRAIIRQAADGCNRASLRSGPGRWFKKSPTLAGRARNDTMACLVRRAGLQHRTPGRKFSA